MKSKILYLIIISLLFACSDKNIKIGDVVISQNNDTLLISENKNVLKVRNIFSYDTMQTCRDVSKCREFGKKVENLYYEIEDFISDTSKTQEVFEAALDLADGKLKNQNKSYFEDTKTDSLFLLMNHHGCGLESDIMVSSYGDGKTLVISSERYVIYQTYYSDCDCYKFRFSNRLNYAMQTW